jgi:two-component system chemotaxis response regulator CheB
MEKIRVLIVDDSATMRRIIADALSSDPLLEVAGTAANGRIALEMLPLLKPDVMTLDIEMPEMDGLQTIPRVRADFKHLPIIMFSSLTEQGAKHTLDALALGASDYVAKPTAQAGGAAKLRDVVAGELLGKIKALVSTGRIATSPVLAPREVKNDALSLLQHRRVASVEIVAVGVSTGGPSAVLELLSGMPPDLGVPIVLVQHMPPGFTKIFAERVNGQSPLTVVEAEGSEVLKPNWVYVAPGGYHMELQRRGSEVVVAVNDLPPENSVRPAVDVLFRSVAALFGERALAAVLTGMGQDGLKGAHSIKQAGGVVLAQDEASSVVWGMPGAVVRAGLASAVLSIADVAPAIVEIVRLSQRVQAPRGG